jgi:hypothetical protein
MPINFNLEEIRQINDCKNYFETGLWMATTDNISCRQALKCGFNKVYCIEIRKDFIELGKEVLKTDIESNRLTLINDDSVNLDKYINNIDFTEKTIFYLDAHVDNSNITNYIKKCPLFDELLAISKLDRKDHVILIDDLRIIKELYPWDERSYGNIDFFDEIKKLITKINEKYVFSYLNGYEPNDVLYAYVPNF